MNKLILLTFLLTFFMHFARTQDTFSIVAVDSVTGEVGSAGASCVDLFQTGFSDDDFLAQLIPNVGAINTQAYYIPSNQNNATNRMNAGDTPSEIINWLVENDVQNQPQFRQYGIAALVNGSPQTAAYTGTSTDDYKNHIIGPDYSIQGNILLGQEVLDSMEFNFLNENGDLACKLMAALQGANMIGADTRCNGNGTSSLFAFVKVAQPSDDVGNPSFLVSVRTSGNAGIEPIDSLQTKFDQLKSCDVLDVKEEDFSRFFSVYPNPTTDFITLENKTNELYDVFVYDVTGHLILQDSISKTKKINFSHLAKGAYLVKITNLKRTVVKKIVVH